MIGEMANCWAERMVVTRNGLRAVNWVTDGGSMIDIRGQ